MKGKVEKFQFAARFARTRVRFEKKEKLFNHVQFNIHPDLIIRERERGSHRE